MQGFKLKRLNIMCIMRHILYTIKIKQNSQQYTKVPYNIAQNKYLSNEAISKLIQKEIEKSALMRSKR